jgi:hypothetical protein
VPSPSFPLPPHIRLLPPVEVLLERMHNVEAEVAQLEAKRAQTTDKRALAAISAHVATLTRKREWYLSRIRTSRPIEALAVRVEEHVNTHEST